MGGIFSKKINPIQEELKKIQISNLVNSVKFRQHVLKKDEKKRIQKQGTYGSVFYVKYNNNLIGIKKSLKTKEPTIVQNRIINTIQNIQNENFTNYFAKYYGYFNTNDNSYLCMEYLNSKDGWYELSSVIENSELNEEEVNTICLKLKEMVHEFKNNNFVHNDIKPENIFYNINTHEVKCIDLGFSFFTNENDQKKENLRKGTPYYIPPICIDYFEEPTIENEIFYNKDLFGICIICLKLKEILCIEETECYSNKEQLTISMNNITMFFDENTMVIYIIYFIYNFIYLKLNSHEQNIEKFNTIAKQYLKDKNVLLYNILNIYIQIPESKRDEILIEFKKEFISKWVYE